MEILIALVISLAINLLMFVPAFLFKTDKLTDISYAITFIVLALYSFLFNPINLNTFLLIVMLTIWALRLGVFLLLRVKKVGKDKRFDEMRSNFWRFGRFWLLQGISVWIIMIPSLFFFNSDNEILSSFSYLGIIIWLFGIIIETTADIQKFIFKSNPQNDGQWIETGLWKYSRHPNYFGEITIWIGLYIFVFFNLSFWESIVGAIGPLYIACIILFVSGIPILEKSANNRWGALNQYQIYKKKTNVLIPWLNRK